jgi:chromosome segregation ATPase
MQPMDHKAVLRKLAEEDGCQASLKAAAHIEYIERRLVSALDRVRHLQQKLHNTRSQRNELRQQLKEKENAGIPCGSALVPNRCSGMGDGSLSGVSDV